MINSIFILAVALFLVIKGATYSTKHAGHLAETFNLSRYTVGFIIVAIISILPEAFIAINSALQDIPSFGLGTLFGSNVADLTLVFALIVAFANRGIKIESKVLSNNKVYPLLLLLPLVLGFDGYLSRVEGISLIIAGVVFYYLSFKNGISDSMIPNSNISRKKSTLLLIGGMIMLLVGAHFTVTSAVDIATLLGIKPILIGLLIVGLGTTMPELLFSIHAVRNEHDDLAVGDILGTVLADATIVVGILATLNPFRFPAKIVYITGVFMLLSAIILLYFMKSGKVLTKSESRVLFLFWVSFILVEFFANYSF